MSKAGMQLYHDMIKFYADAASEPVYVTRAKVVEKLSTVPEMTVEFTCESRALDLEAMLGTPMRLEIGTGDFVDGAYASTRKFSGTCVSIQSLGQTQGFAAFSADIRPWLWFLTKMSNNTVYAELTAPAIIKKVMNDAGFSDIEDRLSGSFRSRHYTVQYNETHFAFISRLMEEEGIYYFFDYSGTVEKLVLANSPGSHSMAEGKNDFKFDPRIGNTEREKDEIYDWKTQHSVATGKVKLVDYDMTKPKASLLVKAAKPKGNHSHKNYEKYVMQGHYSEVADGDTYARVRMEREALAASTVTGQGNARTLQCGAKIKMGGHPLNPDLEAVLLGTTYFFDAESRSGEDGYSKFTKEVSKLDLPEMRGPVQTDFSVIPASEPYRPPAETPLPDMSGLHVGIVVGPDGDEIYTDSFGRIRVMFPWMLGTDELTFWVRVSAPWAGQGYGFYGVPRIGQEVIIQFERNNPDYPICTGMLYNAVSTNPLSLPGDMTKQGIKTKSTKGGAQDAFNELTFDDLNGHEMVTFQSEKDYTQIIKNNATITIGMEKAAAGDLHQTIKTSKFEFIKEGDYKQKVEKGNRDLYVKTNHTDVIEGKSTTTITGDTARTIKTGNVTETVKTGNVTTVIKTGNVSTTVKTGNVSNVINTGNSELKVKTGNHKMTIATGHNTTTVKTGNNSLIVNQGHNNITVGQGNMTETINIGNVKVKAKAGKITLDAATSIKLKVGGSSIEITPNSIIMKSTTIKLEGTNVEAKGSAKADFGGGIVSLEASGILTVKGSLVKIN